MSSLNATQADGYYIPPDYLQSGAYKKKSLNQFNNDKSNKSNNSSKQGGHNQYLRNSVVRFELPYDGFCLSSTRTSEGEDEGDSGGKAADKVGCLHVISKGTRFNAHKAHVGDYFTTKIYEFTMKCRICKTSKFVIRTNPKGRCFDYISGIKKKVEEFDTIDAKSLGMIDTEDGNGIQSFTNRNMTRSTNECKKSTSVNINTSTSTSNAIDKLQKEKIGERKAMTERDAMEKLMKYNNITMLNDATSNSNLRSKYRVVRKAKKRRLEEAQRKGLGMGIELLESTDADSNLSHSVFVFHNEKNVNGIKKNDDAVARRIRHEKSQKVEKQKFGTIRASSIFSHNGQSQNQTRSQKTTQSQNYSIKNKNHKDNNRPTNKSNSNSKQQEVKKCQEKKIQKQKLRISKYSRTIINSGGMSTILVRDKIDKDDDNDKGNNNDNNHTNSNINIAKMDNTIENLNENQTSLSYLMDGYGSSSSSDNE
jgi:coiled-coil domain-containing protein 130